LGGTWKGGALKISFFFVLQGVYEKKNLGTYFKDSPENHKIICRAGKGKSFKKRGCLSFSYLPEERGRLTTEKGNSRRKKHTKGGGEGGSKK